ncbi:MAG: M36 family metallopeptidase [Ferruginibacter sp.]|nr:M36 family metallopeptidase [Ferruginibacter sp.]
MKKHFLFAGLLIFAFYCKAQVPAIEKNIAARLLEKNISATGLQSGDLGNSIISGTYTIPGTTIRMVHVQQVYQDIPVYNQLQVLAFKNDQLVSTVGERLQTIDRLTGNASGIPVISAATALKASLAALNVRPPQDIMASISPDNGKKIDFGKQNVSIENMTAELIWLPVDEGKALKLAWQVFVAPLNDEDYWLVRIDAKNNSVINKQSLTVKCNWDNTAHSVKAHVNNLHPLQNSGSEKEPVTVTNNSDAAESPLVVNTARYRVIKYPAESPLHPGGANVLVTDPWTMSPGNATSLGWHNDGSIIYSNTRGNNVYAYEDRDANNQAGISETSATPQPSLSFDFVPDFTLAPSTRTTAPNQQFNTTNLFYWNNLMHDFSYLYGFDEASGNFQNNNQGRGGAEGDYVLAEAQDGSGTNNANFSTPADGGRGRMQMYLWTAPSPDRDGDVDNGIIAHEYTHGISNRLTGNGSTCLTNAEQMGEGWSDYFALMITHDWANALPGDGFSKPRGIGTYALNQPNTGLGIRQYRYTTDMAVNPMTYGNLASVVAPHGVGTIWCTALWDMTWEIIQQTGINQNIFNINGTGGNSIALKLVMEGLRLQPCSPGFIDGRNAILKADTLFFAAQYSCAIIKAFARRGMGIGALQGSSNSRNDQTLSFLDCSSLTCNAPTGLATTAITTNSATISWTAVAGAINYTAEYKLNAASAWTTAAASTTATSVNINGLTDASLYDWQVLSNCANGSSSNAQAQFTTATIVTCVAPTGLATTAITTNSATTSWTAVAGAVSYTVQYKLNIASAWTTAAASTTATSVNINGLTDASLYDWQVLSNCANGSSSAAQAQFTTATIVTCVAPTGLTTTAITTNSATTSWTAVAGAVNYTVEYKQSSAIAWTVAAAATTSTSVSITGLAEATDYNWRVSANCAEVSSVSLTMNFKTASAGCASQYDIASNGTAAGAALIPVNTDITGLISPVNDNDYYKFVILTTGTATVTLTSLPDDYDIRLYKSNGNSQLAISQNGGTRSESFARTYLPGNYYLKVYGYDGANNSNDCYTLKIDMGTASFGETPVEDIITKTIVFPNPATKSVTVRMNELKGTAEILLFDIYGKLLAKQRTSQLNTNVDISSLPSGTYIIRIKNKEKETNLKIVKQK